MKPLSEQGGAVLNEFRNSAVDVVEQEAPADLLAMTKGESEAFHLGIDAMLASICSVCLSQPDKLLKTLQFLTEETRKGMGE